MPMDELKIVALFSPHVERFPSYRKPRYGRRKFEVSRRLIPGHTQVFADRVRVQFTLYFICGSLISLPFNFRPEIFMDA